MELIGLLFQGLRRVTKPYITRVATASRPHVNRLRVALDPYMKGPVRVYGKFVESATTCHYQVSTIIFDWIDILLQ